MQSFELLQGDCTKVLATLPDASIQCCITSPPYWQLRDYQTSSWIGGAESCDHVADSSKTKKFGNDAFNENRPSREETKTDGYYFKDICGKCGAKRSDLQIGLEQTPEAYVAKMVLVFREVWRVLRDDGTLWLNLGDSYAGNNSRASNNGRAGFGVPREGVFERTGVGLKSKDLVGIPWRVAFALQADGWYLRQDIIWHKPNPMPESVTDRCTKAHEYIFLLTKSQKYTYDAEAIKEPSISFRDVGDAKPTKIKFGGNKYGDSDDPKYQTKSGNEYTDNGKRNKRSVWTVTTKPYSEAHFATFPPDLIEPCVLAGTSEKGCCEKCGSPWERVVEKETNTAQRNLAGKNNDSHQRGRVTSRSSDYGDFHDLGTVSMKFLGWRATCKCEGEPVPCVVLDPFNGAGTTGVVSIQNGRRYIGIELNPEYLEISRKRIQQTWEGITMPLFGLGNYE